MKEQLAPLLVHVRFPLIDGKAIHDDVEPSGLVSDALLFEAYRYHASGVIIEGNARFRPRSASATMTASAAVALTEWELTLPSGPYVLNGAVLSTNTKEALLDGNFETGVTTNTPGSIVATCGPLFATVAPTWTHSAQCSSEPTGARPPAQFRGADAGIGDHRGKLPR